MGTSANVLKDIMGTIVKKVNVIRECKKIKNKDPWVLSNKKYAEIIL